MRKCGIGAADPHQAQRVGVPDRQRAHLVDTAFAGGERHVARVDVSIDGGASWSQAELLEDLGPWAWRRWRITFDLAPGEHEILVRRQPALGLPTATRAALIPITKSQAWWRLSQEEQRAIFEERSHHIAVGLEYLPAVARPAR